MLIRAVITLSFAKTEYSKEGYGFTIQTVTFVSTILSGFESYSPSIFAVVLKYYFHRYRQELSFFVFDPL